VEWKQLIPFVIEPEEELIKHSKEKIMRLLLLPLAALALLPLQLNAITLHVYPGESIQDHIDLASSGDIVFVHSQTGGYTYYESIVLKSGVTVKSVVAESDVTIDGGTGDYTVQFSGNGSGMYFGDQDEGFIIKGGTRAGIYLNQARNMTVAHMDVESDPTYSPLAAVYCYMCHSDLYLISLEIYEQVNSCGLFLDWGEPHVRDIRVYNVEGVGIRAYRNETYFSDPLISYCTTGFEFEDAFPFIDMGVITACDYGIYAYNDYAYPPSANTVMGVEFEDCGVGAVVWSNDEIWVHFQGCQFSGCTDGIHLGRAYGYAKGCSFVDIGDIAIKTNGNGGTLVLGGPTGIERNTFLRVDGTGILVENGASPSIRGEFHEVLGTGILCQSGSTPTIADSRFYGSNGCFQAIRTSGSTTMAAVRNDTIQDYDSAVIPLPRGVSVTDLFMSGPAANLGTTADRGYNYFYDNTTDLLYGPMISQPGQTPVSMYAQYNFWGEDPPSPQSFGGSWANAIVYSPWLHPTPGPVPPLVEDPGIPTEIVLEAIRPNPVSATALISYGLPGEMNAGLDIWDIQGRHVKSLHSGVDEAGWRYAEWDTTDKTGKVAPSGVYFCRLSTKEGAITRRLVLAR